MNTSEPAHFGVVDLRLQLPGVSRVSQVGQKGISRGLHMNANQTEIFYCRFGNAFC